jgi:hypothetical protein
MPSNFTNSCSLANLACYLSTATKASTDVRMRSLLLPAFLAFTAAVLPPNASIGQDAGFGRDADIHVREDSFACKETSELDRLLQRNQSGGFTSGVQLYEYLQSHNCIGLSAGRVRVHATHGQYVCIYHPKGKNKTHKALRLDQERYAFEMNDTSKSVLFAYIDEGHAYILADRSTSDGLATSASAARNSGLE